MPGNLPIPTPVALPDAAPPATASAPRLGWWAVCLCAGWCGTCRDYRALFDALAQAHPEVRFEWVDIEDESELAGDIDVETFPTLLIADGEKARFLGPLLPQAGVLTRLLASLQERDTHAALNPETQALFERVRAARRAD
jgi:thioredoxin 1